LIFRFSIDTVFTVIVAELSECLACHKNSEKHPTGVRQRWLTRTPVLSLENPMRDDENASTPKKKASRAFYPELPDEVAWFDSLFSLQKARIEEEGQRKTETWHIFETS
jgi:hypothetical protein